MTMPLPPAPPRDSRPTRFTTPLDAELQRRASVRTTPLSAMARPDGPPPALGRLKRGAIDAPGLGELALAAGFTEPPAPGLIASDDLNAFVTIDPRTDLPTLRLSTALAARLSPRELGFVVAHELAHVALGHMQQRVVVDALGGQHRLKALSLLRSRELSADRLAFWAIDADIDAATRALCKTAFAGAPAEPSPHEDPMFIDPELDGVDPPWEHAHPPVQTRVKALSAYGRPREAEQLDRLLVSLEHDSQKPAHHRQQLDRALAALTVWLLSRGEPGAMRAPAFLRLHLSEGRRLRVAEALLASLSPDTGAHGLEQATRLLEAALGLEAHHRAPLLARATRTRACLDALSPPARS